MRQAMKKIEDIRTKKATSTNEPRQPNRDGLRQDLIALGYLDVPRSVNFWYCKQMFLEHLSKRERGE